ncbi:MFS transporter [Comamonas sp. JC664]|uniref:MFS transporter n=1 Tax=Comamonas sp. JC664 TaxID=2801917 RepID=UPI0017497771|nr:MFS transporter [Comamonas sp. JC664]MBL0697879.1 MFS transporter [Comamonas sp. JC664]GHG70119.1 AmpG family muropeptide MFS transporter [Comamonas sp. KCTC 72670]
MRLPASRLALLGVLYFVQGLPFGFQSTALPVYLRSQGVSLTTIGLLGALWLPWAFKALWAPLVDRYGSERVGRRKSWILPMQAGLTVTCAAAAFVSSHDSLPWLLGLIFLMNLFAATQDIAVDGFAVDTLRPSELGLGNTAQVVGYKLGMLTGGGLLVWASDRIGWQGLFIAMALLCLGAFVLTIFAREAPPASREPQPSVSARREPDWRELFQRLKQALLLPGSGWLLLFIATYKLGESMSDVLFKPFLVDSGITPAQIGLWVGTWGTAASIVGSLAGGLLASRMSLLGAVGLTATLRVVPLVGRWLLATGGVTDSSIIAVTMAEEFFGGALTTVMFAFMMSRVDRRIGATHYTLLASLEVWGKAPAGPLAGWLADPRHGLGLGYASVFLLGIVLSVAFLGLLVPLRRQQPAARSALNTA